MKNVYEKFNQKNYSKNYKNKMSKNFTKIHCSLKIEKKDSKFKKK